ELGLPPEILPRLQLALAGPFETQAVQPVDPLRAELPAFPHEALVGAPGGELRIGGPAAGHRAVAMPLAVGHQIGETAFPGLPPVFARPLGLPRRPDSRRGDPPLS